MISGSATGQKKTERREGTVKSRINYNKRVNLNQRNQLRNQSRKIRNNLLANRKQDARIGNYLIVLIKQGDE